MSAAPMRVRVRLPLDRFALDVDFETNAAVTGVFGPSGSGKTSLLETIAGLRRPAEAAIEVGGARFEESASRVRLSPEARRVGWVPQDLLLFPHLDVRGNLLAGARRGDDVLDSVVSTLELAPLLPRDVRTLSGGEKQRVAIGRALCSAPRLLLLDEPLSAVDAALRGRILAFLRRVRERFAVPMLVVSHDPLVAQALCDDLVVLREGCIRARGAPARVLTDPEVFPMAEAEGFRNVLPCRVEGTSAVRLGISGTGALVRTMPVAADLGAEALVAFPASDVLVAVEEPRGLSARNVVPAEIVSLVEVGPMRLARCAVLGDVPEVVVELTSDACEALELRPGRSVHLVIKAAACAVLAG